MSFHRHCLKLFYSGGFSSRSNPSNASCGAERKASLRFRTVKWKYATGCLILFFFLFCFVLLCCCGSWMSLKILNWLISQLSVWKSWQRTPRAIFSKAQNDAFSSAAFGCHQSRKPTSKPEQYFDVQSKDLILCSTYWHGPSANHCQSKRFSGARVCVRAWETFCFGRRRGKNVGECFSSVKL